MQKRNKLKSIGFVLFTVGMGCLFIEMMHSCNSKQVTSTVQTVTVSFMQGFPCDEGISLGVSAGYAGINRGKLLIAGGCNFPDVPAAEGGKKRFYQGIYITEFDSDSVFHWKKAGDLPVPAAYGVSITMPDGVICIGGTNTGGALSSVFRLSLTDGGVMKTDTLPSLPCTIDNMGGAVIGNTLFVAGGNVDGRPSNAVYSLDLNNLKEGWNVCPAFPGSERVQPVCIAQDSTLYIWGGFSPAFDGKKASVSTNGYAYSLKTGEWKELATPVDAEGNPVTFGGGVGTALPDGKLLCAGGVNKSVFLSALKREETLKGALAKDNRQVVDSLKVANKAYMLQPVEYYRFNKTLWIYDVITDEWIQAESFPQMARAGAALVGNGEKFYLINGELKPGVRTPEISKVTIQK